MKEYRTIKINTFTSNEQLESMLNEKAKEGFILIPETFRSEFLVLEKDNNIKIYKCKVKDEADSTETD